MFWKRSSDPTAALREQIGDYELPTFSATAVATLGLLREDAPMARVAERILGDPGLSVRILRTANSAAFGLRQKATNLEYAANLLGRSRVESLVLAAAVGDALPAPGSIDVAGFWRTSAHRACLARKIAASVHPAREVESFTAALLQDMAVPVLAASHRDRYAAVYQRSLGDPSAPLQLMEREAFGYDHSQVGAMMAEAWDLPDALIAAIADHHLVGERAPDAVEAVSLVRHCDPPDELQGLRDHCQGRLHISAPDVDAMIEAASMETSALADSLRPASSAAIP